MVDLTLKTPKIADFFFPQEQTSSYFKRRNNSIPLPIILFITKKHSHEPTFCTEEAAHIVKASSFLSPSAAMEGFCSLSWSPGAVCTATLAGQQLQNITHVHRSLLDISDYYTFGVRACLNDLIYYKSNPQGLLKRNLTSPGELNPFFLRSLVCMDPKGAVVFTARPLSFLDSIVEKVRVNPAGTSRPSQVTVVRTTPAVGGKGSISHNRSGGNIVSSEHISTPVSSLLEMKKHGRTSRDGWDDEDDPYALYGGSLYEARRAALGQVEPAKDCSATLSTSIPSADVEAPCKILEFIDSMIRTVK